MRHSWTCAASAQEIDGCRGSSWPPTLKAAVRWSSSSGSPRWIIRSSRTSLSSGGPGRTIRSSRRCAGQRSGSITAYWKSTPWWGRCDLDDAHIFRAADRPVLLDVFCMAGAELYGAILEDVTEVYRQDPRERMRYALEIPYIARENSAAEILALRRAWAGAASDGQRWAMSGTMAKSAYLSRRSRIACFRAFPDRRSTNSRPLRWSTSCWMQRASMSSPSTTTGFPSRSAPLTLAYCALRTVSRPGDGQASFLVFLFSLDGLDLRVDEVPDLPIDVVGKDAAASPIWLAASPPVPARRRSPPDRPPGDERAVELVDSNTGGAEHWIAEQADGTLGHRPIVP